MAVGAPGLGGNGAVIIYEFDGQFWQEQAIVRGPGARQDLYFGQAVSLDADRLLVGAPGFDDMGFDSGSAIVFEFDGLIWEEVARLHPANLASGNRFGYAVGLSDGHALVGTEVLGDVYAFALDSGVWTEVAKLERPEGASRFGSTIDIEGNRALVGSQDTRGQAVFVYEFNGISWEMEHTIDPSLSSLDNFGSSIDLEGDRALIGAPGGMTALLFDFDGTSWVESHRFEPAQSSNEFGSAVSLLGSTALIGAYESAAPVFQAGSAHVFEFDGQAWTETQTLLPDETHPEKWFGAAVGLFGDQAVVGARAGPSWDPAGVGATYSFSLADGTWSQQQQLMPEPGAVSIQFGRSIRASGNRVIVGSGTNGSWNGGPVFLFEEDQGSWNRVVQLQPSEPVEDLRFGVSVGLSGDHAMVGATVSPFGVPQVNYLYAYQFDGSEWVERQRLISGDEPIGFVPASISIDGDLALIGTPSNSENGNLAGAAYVFAYEDGEWALAQKLLAPEGAAFDRFGTSVSLSGNRALVGAPEADGLDVDSGAAYLFEFNGQTWQYRRKLRASDGSYADAFGGSVSLSGDTMIVGARRADPDDSGSIGPRGAAYLFTFDGNNWVEAQIIRPDYVEPSDQFGTWVEIDSTRAVIVSNPYSGEYYATILRRQGEQWLESQRITDFAWSDYANGGAVGLSPDRVFLGAPFEDEQGSESGSVHVFKFLSHGLFSDRFQSRGD